jgi:hypothetical protein
MSDYCTTSCPIYYCPRTGEIECPLHGPQTESGEPEPCCTHPEDHEPIVPEVGVTEEWDLDSMESIGIAIDGRWVPTDTEDILRVQMSRASDEMRRQFEIGLFHTWGYRQPIRAMPVIRLWPWMDAPGRLYGRVRSSWGEMRRRASNVWLAAHGANVENWEDL